MGKSNKGRGWKMEFSTTTTTTTTRNLSDRQRHVQNKMS